MVSLALLLDDFLKDRTNSIENLSQHFYYCKNFQPLTSAEYQYLKTFTDRYSHLVAGAILRSLLVSYDLDAGIVISYSARENFRLFAMTASEDRRAKRLLGSCYLEGSGTNQDYAMAVMWYEAAINQGDIAAKYLLGKCYDEGLGVKQDFKKACEHYEAAANQGHAAAQFTLCKHLAQGKGIEPDSATAHSWLSKAATAGHPDAQCEMGYYCVAHQEKPQDLFTADTWFEKAAYHGSKEGQNSLGSHYFHGICRKKDLEKAMFWYKKSAYQDWSIAQANLGCCYELINSIKEAIYWYEKAARQGLAIAQYRLGVLYQTGKGVSKNTEKAFHYHQQAAWLGFKKAQARLINLYSEIAENSSFIESSLQRPATNNNPHALFNLGLYFENKKTPNFRLAADYYLKAIIHAHTAVLSADEKKEFSIQILTHLAEFYGKDDPDKNRHSRDICHALIKKFHENNVAPTDVEYLFHSTHPLHIRCSAALLWSDKQILIDVFKNAPEEFNAFIFNFPTPPKYTSLPLGWILSNLKEVLFTPSQEPGTTIPNHLVPRAMTWAAANHNPNRAFYLLEQINLSQPMSAYYTSQLALVSLDLIKDQDFRSLTLNPAYFTSHFSEQAKANLAKFDLKKLLIWSLEHLSDSPAHTKYKHNIILSIYPFAKCCQLEAHVPLLDENVYWMLLACYKAGRNADQVQGSLEFYSKKVALRAQIKLPPPPLYASWRLKGQPTHSGEKSQKTTPQSTTPPRPSGPKPNH